MLKKLCKYYIGFSALILIKICLVFAASVCIAFTFQPYKWLYVLSVVALSLFLSYYVVYLLRRLGTTSFIWTLEKNNPELGENLISYFELRDAESPYKKILEDRLKEVVPKKLHLGVSTVKEFRFVYFSIILLLTSVSLFPSKYTHLDQVPLMELQPRVVLAFSDSLITFRAPLKLNFYVQEPMGNIVFKVRDSTLQIKFGNEGTYKIFGRLGNKKTIPAVAKIIQEPIIDSFYVMTIDKNHRNPQWIVSIAGAPVKIKIFASPEYQLAALVQNEVVKNSQGQLELTLKPEQDFNLYAELSQGVLKKRFLLTTFSIVPNLPPRIIIEEPAALYSYIPEDMKQKILGQVYDEDGVKVIYLHYSLRGSYRRTKIPGDAQKSRKFQFIIDLEKELMLPGDELKFYVLAEDQQGLIDSSELYTVIFPTLEEIYKEEVKKMAEFVSEFNKGTETFSRVTEKINKTLDSLRANPLKRETETEEVDELIREMERMTDEFSSVIENLELLQHITVSPELLQKLQRVGEELYKLMEKELPDLLKKLQTLNDSTSKFKKADLEELEKHAQEIMENLSYMEQLLEMARKEMIFKEAQEKIEQLIEKRHHLKNLTQSESTDKIKELEEQFEEELRETFEDISQRLDSLDIEDNFNERASSIVDLQQKIVKSASKGSKKQTTSLQHKQAEELNQLLAQNRKLGESAIQQDMEKLIETINEIRKGLLITSLELEENIHNNAFLVYVHRSLERIRGELSKVGILILMYSPRVPRLVDIAMDSLYENPNVSLSYINSAIFELFRIQAMAKSSSQGGGIEAMKFLENLMKQQASMIRETGAQIQIPMPMPQSYQNSMLEKISEMKSQLVSMYMNAENQEVREKIEEALKGLQKTEEKLKHRELDQELVETQRKTLKHLLEAHGIYKREEFAEKRYSEPAKPYLFTPPRTPEIINELKLIENMRNIKDLPPEKQKLISEFYYKLLRL
ncbi:MAG TPA: hypothetical protein PKU67_01760 [Candidatus Hydrothermia bacterium]|nr:hypothetical protein [Candidatus Hydrothermia bacterium]HOK22745.1 hypothetical protein [Candidatus Hydrothermia bacterium]HOL23454.1 hypothetical protein [Candidatus Hydrothermia bacterium]HPO78362.1 hypothetical protein [Candidatus Hydrothermia bacterium]